MSSASNRTPTAISLLSMSNWILVGLVVLGCGVFWLDAMPRAKSAVQETSLSTSTMVIILVVLVVGFVVHSILKAIGEMIHAHGNEEDRVRRGAPYSRSSR